MAEKAARELCARLKRIDRQADRRIPLSETVQVRALQRADFPQWQPLWDGYNAFYGRAGETALAPDITHDDLGAIL